MFALGADDRPVSIFNWTNEQFGSTEIPAATFSKESTAVSLSPSGSVLVSWSVSRNREFVLEVWDVNTNTVRSTFDYTSPGKTVWESDEAFVTREAGSNFRKFKLQNDKWSEHKFAPLDDIHGRRIECFHDGELVSSTVKSEIVTKNSIIACCHLADPIEVDDDHLLVVCDEVAAVYSRGKLISKYEDSEMVPLALVAISDGWEYYYIQDDSVFKVALSHDFGWGDATKDTSIEW